MKTFSYKVNCLNLEKSIKVDPKKTPTVSDLKSEISKELYVDNTKIKIDEDLNLKLKDFHDQHKFMVSIETDHKGITFVFPNNDTFFIDNCYQKNVFDVNKLFQHKHIFYSKKCITNNQRFEISGKYLPVNAEYPFLSPTNNTAFVKLTGDVVYIKYGYWKFFLSDKEKSEVLYKFLREIYGDKIYIYKKNKKVSPDDKLKKSKDYKIIVEKLFTFQKFNFGPFHHRPEQIKLDLLTTVYEAQKRLAPMNYFASGPENIILYKGEKEINDPNLMLIKIHKITDPFYYGVVIFHTQKNQPKQHQHQHQHQQKKQTKNVNQDCWKITFYVKCKNNANIEKDTLDVCKKMKIKHIKNILVQRYSIDSSIKIKLKNKKVVNDKKRIIEIAKELRNDGKNELFIYEDEKAKQKQKLKLKQKPKVTKPPKQKVKENSDEDDNDDAKNVQKSKTYNEKPSKQKVKGKHDDDDDDDIGDIKNAQKSKSCNDKLSKKPVKKPAKKQQGSTPMIKYIYQTNMDPEDEEIEMEEEATVKDMKEKIGEEKGIDNIYDIKIIFAGKELLNELVLKELNIGDIKLFIYIRTQEDILLMTAKALQMNEYSSSDSSSIIEEEEEENDD